MAKNLIIGEGKLRIGLVIKGEYSPVGTKIECTQGDIDKGYIDKKTVVLRKEKAIKDADNKKQEVKDNK